MGDMLDVQSIVRMIAASTLLAIGLRRVLVQFEVILGK